MIAGNTVRITGSFPTFAGTLADPEDLLLKIYDAKKIQVGDDYFPIKIDTGIFYCDVTLPTRTGDYYAEWSGVMEGSPIVSRSRIDVNWL